MIKKNKIMYCALIIPFLFLSCAKGYFNDRTKASWENKSDNPNLINDEVIISSVCDVSISKSAQNKYISDFKQKGIKIFGVSHITTDPCGINRITGDKLFPDNWQVVNGKEYCLEGKKAEALHNIIEGVMRNTSDPNYPDTNTYEYKITETNYGALLGDFGTQINKYTREFHIAKVDANDKSSLKVYIDGFKISENDFLLRNSKNRSSVYISDDSLLIGKNQVRIVYDPYNQIEGDYVRDSDYSIKLPVKIFIKEKIEVYVNDIKIDSDSYYIDNSIPAIVLDKHKILLEIGTKVRVRYVG